MNFVLDLSKLNTERYFIVGDLLGNHQDLINLLYHQRFSHKDTLITTGNFIDLEQPTSHDLWFFLKNAVTAYSVKGKNEFNLENKFSEDRTTLPTWITENPKINDLMKFINELPLIIKVSDYIYVVSAGVEPGKDIEDQDPTAFYTIGDYDKDSRFYQFDNPDKKSWYEFSLLKGENPIKFCFGTFVLDKPDVPGGFSLGHTKGKPLKYLIFKKGNDEPIYLESI